MSSSSSASRTSTTTRDGRVAGDNGAIGVSAEGDVDVHIVADEAFELGELAIHSIAELADNQGKDARNTVEDVTGVFAEALATTQQRSNSETTQLVEKALTVGLPILALAFAASKIWGK